MDPDRALEDLRADIQNFRDRKERGESWSTTAPLAEDIIDEIQNIDEWIMSGGFIPTSWSASIQPKRDEMQNNVNAIDRDNLAMEYAFAKAAIDWYDASTIRWAYLIKERMDNA